MYSVSPINVSNSLDNLQDISQKTIEEQEKNKIFIINAVKYISKHLDGRKKNKLFYITIFPLSLCVGVNAKNEDELEDFKQSQISSFFDWKAVLSTTQEIFNEHNNLFTSNLDEKNGTGYNILIINENGTGQVEPNSIGTQQYSIPLILFILILSSHIKISADFFLYYQNKLNNLQNNQVPEIKGIFSTFKKLAILTQKKTEAKITLLELHSQIIEKNYMIENHDKMETILVVNKNKKKEFDKIVQLQEKLEFSTEIENQEYKKSMQNFYKIIFDIFMNS
jgi:hypothetical protein